MKEEPQPPVKKETYDLSPNYDSLNLASLAEEVAKRINSLEKQQPAGGSNPPRIRTNQCLFCSDTTHYLGGCPKVAEYIQKGLCQKNAEGFIVLPNGNRISTRDTPGKNLKERLDNWHKTNGTTQVSTNFVTASDRQPNYGSTNQDKSEGVLTEREAEDIRTLENLVVATQQKIDNAKKKKQEKGSSGLATRSKQAQEKQADNSETQGSTGPQYRYVSPIEDPTLIKKIANQTLDLPITMSTRELFSVSPEIRRHVKDQLITKRISTSTLMDSIDQPSVDQSPEIHPTYLSRVAEENLVVANHVEELRVINVMIHGVKVIATVDDGSQILSIRQDVWERLGLPLRSDKIMVMESANKTKDETMGLLQDLKVQIGEYDFYLQVQVVKDAPYELLLGRPFLTLTQANHKHFTNGESRLTLIDPNTRDTITVPTRSRRQQDELQGFR